MPYKSLAKKIGLLSAAALLCIGTARFCHRQTEGFAVAKVRDNFSLTPLEKSSSLSSEEQEQLRTLLQQPFTYLGRGKQSFVFESQDEKYVLKLFNNHYHSRIFFLKLAFPFFTGWSQGKIAYNVKKLYGTFLSYQIAFDELREETALVSVHLEPTETLQQPLVIIDKLGIRHELSADKTAFLIQKKASLVYPTLLALKQDPISARSHIKSLMDLLLLRYKKGLFDNDALIRTNFGFIEGRAVQIDVGPFSYNPSMKEPSAYTPEIYRVTTSLKHWLEQYYPELVPFLDSQIAEMLTSCGLQGHFYETSSL